MKSYGGIMEEAASYAVLRESFDYVLRGTKRKTCPTGRWLLAHRDEVIAQLREELLSGTFHLHGYKEFHIVERGKGRRIQSIQLRDRIALNALVGVCEKRVKPSYIFTSASSIEGRGGLFLFRRIRKAMRQNQQMRWFYKFDIRKYYESIPQDRLLWLIDRTFREPLVRQVLRECATMMPEGISIGLRASQMFGNLYLNHYLDHRLKDEMGWKWYWRYCDDGVIGAESKWELAQLIEAVHDAAREAGLEVKQSEQVFSIGHRPLDFLGYVIYGDGRVRIRKHIKQRFARRWKRVRSRTRKREIVGSFFGMCKHAHTKHLFKVLTGYNMQDFKDLGIKYVAQDGKKRFDCPTAQLNQLQNRTVVVKDFETGVNTKQGDDRYVVLFEWEDGQEGKFFTNSEEMKQILDKVREAGALPFRTTIVRKNFGNNKYKYCFT